MSVHELLKKRLAEWEVLYDHELAEDELRLWFDTFKDLRCTDALLEQAFRLIQGKAVKYPKPGHLTAALDAAREERSKEAAGESTRNYIAEMKKTPHISELSPAERQEMKDMLERTLAEIAARSEPNFPHARTYRERISEAKRQQDALETSQKPPAPLVAAEKPEPTPEELAEEPPFQATDEDVPF